MKAWFLVALQLMVIAALLLTGPWIARKWWPLEIAGGALLTWAVFTMGLRHLRTHPEVSPGAPLLTRGPYRWIRHPMYAGVLLGMAALVLERPTWERALLWLSLLAALLAKLTVEESLLKQRFPDYAEYCRRTKRLVPFLFTLCVALTACGEEYRVIMWVGNSASKHPDKFPLFLQRLREMNVNTGMVHGDDDPTRWVQARFPYYVENIVNRGLCLKWNSNVRDWSGFVDAWKKTRDKAAFVREPCLDDPSWRKWACDQMRAAVHRHAPQRPLLYDIRDELSVTISANPFDYCFCPKTLAAFREWLKTQYRDLAALNRQWETNFASWDSVMPFSTDEIKARQKQGSANFAPWCDFRTYMDISLANALAEIRRAAHEVDPRALVGIEGTQMPHAFGGYDLWRLSQVLDWVEPYDIAGARAIWGSFMPGKPIYSTIGESNADRARRRLWHLLLEGDAGCIVWWSEDCMDWKSAELALTAKGRALGTVFEELTSPVARLFVRAEREFDPVVIHYSQPSIQVDWLMESVSDGASWVRRFSSYEAKHNQMAKARVRCLQQLRAAGFSPRFALLPRPGETFLMVGSVAMPDREIAAARRARLFADATPALYDEHGTRRSRSPLADVPLVKDWTEAVAHLQPAVRVSPPAAVYRFRCGNARLLAFERVEWQEMNEDLKLRTTRDAEARPVKTEARLLAPAHVYDLRTRQYFGLTDRFSFTLDPTRPSLFAALTEKGLDSLLGP